MRKSVIKRIIHKNPFAVARRHKMRKQLKNTGMTLLCPSCMGGELFHDLGLRFCSPTINLMMFQTDFVKFVTHFDEYMAKEFEFFKHPEYDFPCAKLGDITVHFTHYDSEEQALEKWYARAARIDRDNMFIYCSERDGLTREEIESLGKLKVKGIVVFTAHPFPDIPYVLYIPEFKDAGVVGDIQHVNYPSEKRNYEKYFDFVKWFNEADGGDYDVSPYSRVKYSKED